MIINNTVTPPLSHEDLDIIEALNMRKWKRARKLLQTMLLAGQQPHTEVQLLAAEKLDPDERKLTQTKRPRGKPPAASFQMQIALGAQAERAVWAAQAQDQKALDAMEGLAEQIGVSRRTLEKYRAEWGRFAKRAGIQQTQPQPQVPVYRRK